MEAYETMTAHRLIRQACLQRSKTQAQLAEILGINPKVLSEQLVSDRIPYKRFSQILFELGYEVKVEPIGGGTPIDPRRKGISKENRKMVDGILYDTKKASAVCHTQEQDGWFRELYVDGDGNYFVVHNSLWDKERSYIRPCTEKEAKALPLDWNRL